MNIAKKKFIYTLIFLSPFAFIFISLFIGRYPISVTTILEVLWVKIVGGISSLPDVYKTVIWDIRMPRALMGALVGGSLAISGASLQGLFRNPLVDSGILGVSSGAGFGAALAILLFNSTFMIYIFSFCFGIFAVLMSYLIGKIYSTTPHIMLVLGGVIVSSVFSSLISFAKFVADPLDQLPSITFWLMGSLATASYMDIMITVLPILVGIIGLLTLRWRINVLSMGDKEARALGVNTTICRGIVIICTTMVTASAVCVSGVIGWIGLIIPHVGRMLVGNDNRVLLPVSLSLGASFLILIDNIGRIITGSEIPISILTALVGGPFYVYLLKNTKGGGW